MATELPGRGAASRTSTLDALRGIAAQRPLRFRVAGGSMEPVLPAQTEVMVAHKRVYWPGDLVAFGRDDGAGVVHRVLGYRRHAGRWALVTRGDANRRADRPVPLRRVLGRVMGVPVPAHHRVRALARFGVALTRELWERTR